DFTRNADYSLPGERIKRAIRSAAGDGVTFIDASGIATMLLGNSIAANMFMLGHAWQQGLVPLRAQSIDRAIELNGEAVAMNRDAFVWGRRMAADPAGMERVLAPLRGSAAMRDLSLSLEERVARRANFLTAYQDV